MGLDDFGRMLAAILPVQVRHYHADMDDLPYCVWWEYGDDRLPAKGRQGEIIYSVQVDYFTETEYDPNIDILRDALARQDVPFVYHCSTEEGGRVIHHVFDCSVV